ncbi:MAG: mechanosensitive ion channel family protein [Alphaproteobacteria bacterium]|nr:mechanosensitive ion channel family protein [Alphaproteobacteria bacterium]
MGKLVKILLLAFLLMMSAVTAGTAQPPSRPSAKPVVQQDSETIDFTDIRKKITVIENKIKGNVTREKIDEYVSYLTGTEASIAKKHEEIEKEVKFLQKQLDALGDAQDGNPEDIAITKQRDELSLRLASQDRILKEADLLVIQMEDLTGKILNLRNQKIYGDLMTKQSAFINPLVFFNGVKAYVIFFWDVVKSPVDWYNNLPAEQRSYAIFNIVLMCVILMIALTMAIFLRRFILRTFGYKEEIKEPTFNRKLVAAIAVATARGLIFAFLIIGCILWMVSTKIFAGSLLDTVLMTAAFTSLLAIVEATISRVTFAPNYPQWRLVNISTEKAARFTHLIFTFIILNAIASIQVYIAQEVEYSVETIHFVMIISCAVIAFFLMFISKIAFDTYKDDFAEDISSEDEDIEVSHSFKLILLSHVFCMTIFAASLFGYPELSLFILRHIIMTLILCGLFEVLRRSLIDILQKIIASMPWMRKYRSSKRISAKIDFWMRAVINPAIGLMLIFTLLNLWGLPGDFLLQVAKKLLFGFKIGGIQISLIAIALGISVFFISLTVVKIIKNKLNDNILSKIDIDDGIKHSLVSGVSFIGFIVATLLAIIAMGIDLTSLAFIAGALSVGIGFGLQDVIKNLVAGIIILLERPFRVGDWVVLNGEEGKIKQINIRSTEMETFKRTSVIVPNATLISSSVTNLTHGDNMARQTVKVGVSYGSDPELVRQVLLDSVKECKDILKYPAPYVLFQDFGASSLDFELRFYIKNLWDSWTRPSDLRYIIFKKFAENGIEIPFNQLVVYNGDKANEDRKSEKKQEDRSDLQKD